MNNQDRLNTLLRVQELFSEAEDLLRQVGDRYLEIYVADYLDCNQRMLGEGFYGMVERVINELQEEMEQ